MKAVVAAFNQEKALVGAFSVDTNLRMELFEALGAKPRPPLAPKPSLQLVRPGVTSAASGQPQLTSPGSKIPRPRSGSTEARLKKWDSTSRLEVRSTRDY